MKNKLKVLISAYICEPSSSSEAEVGWQWVSRLSKFHKIVVVSKRPSSSQDVLKLIEGNKNLRFEYYDLPKIFDFMRTGDLRHFIYYNLWQIGAYFHARRLVKKEKFDLVHHLVYVNTWQPTYMAFLGIPFLFGPIGERARLPFVLAKHYGIKVILRENLEAFIKNASRNYSPLMRAIYDRAARIITTYKYVYLKIRPEFRHKALIHPAIGTSLQNTNSFEAFQSNNKSFKVLYVGRFVYLKYPDIALKGFLKFAEKHTNVELIMIGGGKLTNKIQNIAKLHPQGHTVNIYEWRNRDEIISYMNNCDVVLFPTGMVLLEAMSCSKPVIYLNFGGYTEFVTEECGIKIDISNVENIVNDVAAALEILYESENRRVSMGAIARKRLEDNYTWDKNVEWMNRVYQEVISQT